MVIQIYQIIMVIKSAIHVSLFTIILRFRGDKAIQDNLKKIEKIN